jgi:DNA (cytosine-5)-methyltransferase 1
MITVTDLFCGAGGSSLGAEAAGMQLVMAANHWQTAIEVHQAHFPDAGHDCADISQADPRRYPTTDVLLASPECTNHSQARGVSRKRQDPTFWDAPDPAAERSRATMWDVPRFAEQIKYSAIVVENVVEATKWVGWRAWCIAMEDLGYSRTILSHNSMHHGVPQSRDRIYVVFTRKGLNVDLELEHQAWCTPCDAQRTVRQAWKNGRTVGRYRSQWVWACTSCMTPCEPATQPAASIIDWDLPCPRIGDRTRPLAAATRARILAGLQRYGWAPIVTAGAGNVYEATPGNRARGVDEPLATQTTTAQHALAHAPGFLFQTAHGGRVVDLDRPHPTVTASDDRHALVLTNRTNGVPRGVDEPLTTCCAGGNHHGLIVRNYGNKGGDPGRHVTPTEEPLRTVTTEHGMSLVVPCGGSWNDDARSTDQPLRTLTSREAYGLLMRNNGGGAEMITPLEEPARTLTSKGHQSLLMPYYGTAVPQPVGRPMPTVTTRDRCALIDPDQVVDDCGFRMLEPHEIAAAMAFPDGYIPTKYTKKDRVKLAGNAVTPPVMAWITGRIAHAMESA